MSGSCALCSTFSFLAVSLVTVTSVAVFRGVICCVWIGSGLNFIQGGSMQVSIQAVLSHGVCDDGWLCSETACNFKIFEAEMAELCTIP